MIELYLLGRFDLRLEGHLVEIPSRPAQSLLAYLALTNGIAHRRERLAGLIWPDSPEPDARRNLRQALWHIRKAFENQAPLRADDISITFTAGPGTWVDALVVLQKISPDSSLDELAQIVSAYGGELLPGFYDEWVIVERERLQAAFEVRIKALLDDLIEAQRWDQVLEWGKKWIALAGAAEPAYRALMIAYARLGDLSGVGKIYQRCVETLARDLGVEPSEETTRLFNQLSHPSHDQPAKVEILPAHQIGQLGDAAATLKPEELSAEPPFKGLHYFDEADASLFFGREALTIKLLQRLGLLQPGLSGGDNLLVIVGASGSGKSSLVRAGLVAAVRENRRTDAQPDLQPQPAWEIQVITPSVHPLEILATCLTRQIESVTSAATLLDDMAHEPRSLRLFLHKASAPLFLIVDQMEELFTLCRQDNERQAFIDNLLAAAEAGHCKIVLALRADFYPHCARFENLRAALASSQEYIGPMTAAELRRAIEGPAEHGGYTFEPGLVDLILREVGNEPGALPLLSHALLETWKRRQGRTLTLTGYAETGGVHGAIAHTAERLYLRLSPEQQRIARNIFLRLTELGEGVQDTRRRATPEELVVGSEERSSVDEVLNLLAGARLVTMSQGSVEVAHEALIREWPTLRAWLSEDREGLRLQRHLSETARSWEALERDPGELYRGTRLAQALDWHTGHPDELNELEREFLAASQAQSEQEAAESEAARQREIEAARQIAEAEKLRAESEQRRAESEKRRAEEQARTAQRFRWLAAGLAVLLLAAIVLVNLTLQQRTQARNAALLSSSRELAAAAVSNLSVDPERSLLLALEAVKQANTKEATDALHKAVQTSRLRRTFQVEENEVVGIEVNPDGKQLATGGADGSARIWDIDSGKLLTTLSGHAAMINYVCYSPDGSRLATASDDETAKIWDIQTGHEVFTFHGHTGYVTAVKFSPDGKTLVTVGEDGTIRIWEVNSGKALRVIHGHSQIIRDFAISPDGSRLVTGSGDQTARVWETSTGREIFTLSGHKGAILGVAYSPDGQTIATVSDDLTTKIWDASSGVMLQSFTGHTNVIQGVAFSPDGNRLATSGYDGRVIIWDLVKGRELFSMSGRPALVFRVGFSPDGSQVASANSDGTAQLWDISPGIEYLTLTGHQATISSVMFSPDGKHLVSASDDGTAAIWDVGTGQALVWLRGHTSLVLRAVFNPDGSRVATASDDLSARIWDASTGEQLVELTGHTQGPGNPFVGVMDVAFSPDGTRLATAGADATIIIWDVASGRQLMQLKGHTDRVNTIAFSPDGSHLASGSDDNTIKIWDMTTGKELMMLNGHTARVWRVAFSPDGTRLASGSTDATVILWDVKTGKQERTLSGHTSTVFTVAFDQLGDRLASASVDGTTKLWDVHSGAELLTLADHHGGVLGVAFNQDGSLLATSGDSGLVRIDYLNTQDLVDLAKKRLTRDLSEGECQQYLHIETCPAVP